MVFGVIAIVEKEPVVNFSVTAHAPRNRFVGVRAVMAIVTVQITEAVTEIPERDHEEDHVSPVEEKHDQERGRERRQLEVPPTDIAISAFAQFSANRADVVAEETEKHITPWIFGLAVVAVAVDRQPIDRVAGFVLPI